MSVKVTDHSVQVDVLDWQVLMLREGLAAAGCARPYCLPLQTIRDYDDFHQRFEVIDELTLKYLRPGFCDDPVPQQVGPHR